MFRHVTCRTITENTAQDIFGVRQNQQQKSDWFYEECANKTINKSKAHNIHEQQQHE